MDRRAFLRRAAGSGVLLAGAEAAGFLAACAELGTGVATAQSTRGLLRLPPVLAMNGLTLTAARATAEIAPGVISPVWSVGEAAASGATLEIRRGGRARIGLRNHLDEPTIVHWHGLRPPEASDGHPRLAIGPGESYAYDFEVTEPAGLYWYHPHPHMRTALQTYMGMAGLIVVRDDQEDALGLPTGAREIPLLLQDKRLDASGGLVYAPVGHDRMEGYLGDVAFVNGVRSPTVEVETALYRLRVLNGSNARIFRIARSDDRPMVLIGSDGGFLAAPVEVPWVELGTGERVDLLVDFSDTAVGSRVSLVSLPFASPAGMGMGMGRMGMGGMGGGGGAAQGAQLDLVEFTVARRGSSGAPIPSSLPTSPAPSPAEAERERVFHFGSMMMNHTINGAAFEMERVDERVRLGATEVWTFINDGPFPHPVHMHAVHFHVLSRIGGRGRLFPWETGPKDTVLLYPGEQVSVVMRFESHRGLFLLHCHNLEHEDMGMMLNFLIE
jgi:FtsP/CotA-like multicopper oxidase with cupredoxin domain